MEAIPSGSLTLDRALGIGGFPKGRIVEIYGPEGAGKTMVSPSRRTGKRRRKVARPHSFDAEHALDVGFARPHRRSDVDGLIISQPDSGEQALEIVDTLVRSGAFDIIVPRLGCGARAPGRARRRNGGFAHGTARPSDVAGAAQACGIDQSLPNLRDLHKTSCA